MAKSIVCKKCGTVYSSAQTVCPKCMTRRPRTNEKIIAGVAIFFIAVGLLCILGSILGDDETTPSQNVSTDSSQVDSTDNNASRISAERNGTQYYNIGDTLDANGLKITLNEISDWNSDNMFIQPKDGYKYIRAYFIMKNTNKTDRLLGSYDFSCYADDAKMESSYYGDDTLSFGNISSGKNIQGYVYFEVPKNAQKIEIEYETNWWTDGKAYFKVK